MKLITNDGGTVVHCLAACRSVASADVNIAASTTPASSGIRFGCGHPYVPATTATPRNNAATVATTRLGRQLESVVKSESTASRTKVGRAMPLPTDLTP